MSANIIHGAYRVKGESYIKGCGPSLSDGLVSAAPELWVNRIVTALSALINRLAGSLAGFPKRALPIRMYVAGGAALHMYTGERVSRDIDATFSHRIALPENLEAAYRDADGAARLLYFDRQYNDMFGLLHKDAHEDSVPLTIEGIDAGILDVRLLSAPDLAVSKLGRFSSQDREDIAALARHKLISSIRLRRRAEDELVVMWATRAAFRVLSR